MVDLFHTSLRRFFSLHLRLHDDLLRLILPLLFLSQIPLGALAQQDSTPSYPTYNMIGTFYSDYFQGRKTSSGEIFDQQKPTAAHCSIKLGTWIRVTNLKNGEQVIVKVNDRCPKRGVLDLSKSAAQSIGIKGTSKVRVEILPSEEVAQQLQVSSASDWKWHTDGVSSPESNLHQSNRDLFKLLPSHRKEEKCAQSATPPASKQDVSSKRRQKNKQVTKPAKTNHHDPLPAQKIKRYNVFLTACPTHDTDRQLASLPIIYREYVTTTAANGITTVVLSIQLPEKQAQTTLYSLHRLYPESHLVEVR